MTGVVLRTITHEGKESAAFVFPYSPLLQIVVFIMIVCAGLVSAMAAAVYLAGGSAARSEGPVATVLAILLGIVGVLLLGAAALILPRERFGRDRGVALLPQGLVARELLRSYFVPWDVLDSAGLQLLSTEYSEGHLGFRLSDSGFLPRWPWARWWRGRSRPPTRGDVYFPTGCLVAPPARVLQAVWYYHRHPEARAKIGTAAGLAELEGILLKSCD